VGEIGSLKKIHLVVFLLYTLIAIAITAPLALHLPDHLLGTDSNATNDTFFSVWIFGWQAHQLIADLLNLFQGNIFYPFQNSLAFSEIILPGALLYLPLAYASGNPILAYNLVLLLTFPLTAWAMYLLALDWMGRTGDERRPTTDDGQQTDPSTKPATSDLRYAIGDRQFAMRDTKYAAFLAGLVFAFCTYKIGELRHIQLLMAMFMPLTLLYLGKFLRAPNFHNGFLTALFFALNALSSLYYAVFLAFAIALYLVVELLLRHFRITRAHVIHGGIASVIAVVLVLPFLLPFFRLERQYNFSEGRDPNLFSARPASYLAAPASQWLYGNLTRGFYVAAKGQPLFPGIAAIVLGVIGIFALWRTKSRAWIFPLLLALMGVVLSFGPYLILDRTTNPVFRYPLPYYFLSLVVSPLKSLNAPARFVVLTMLALGLLAGYGALWLIRRAPRYALAIAAVCAALILVEYSPAPLRLATVDAGANISPVYTYLAHQPPGEPVVEIPMGKPEFADQDKYVVYTYNSLYHLQPLVNGYSTFLPPDYYALVKDVQNFPTKGTVTRLQKWGVQWVVVHSDRLAKADAARVRLDKLKGIVHVQDFGNVWLYRIAP
jgi:hypothetical protein